MKKFILPALAAVLCAGLGACSKDESEDKKSFNIVVVSDSQPMQTEVYKGGNNGADGYLTSFKSEREEVNKVLYGLFGEEGKFTIEAADSADMAKQLHAKADAVFASVKDEGWVGRHEVRVLWKKNSDFYPDVLTYVWGNKNGTPIKEHHENEHKDTDDYNWDECNFLKQASAGVHLCSHEYIEWLTLDCTGPHNPLTSLHEKTYAINQDLNAGANGKYIYLRANEIDESNGEYTDLICIKSEKGYIPEGTTLVWEGRTYIRVPQGFREQHEPLHVYRPLRSADLNGDCNEGAGGAWLFLFYTTHRQNLKYGGDKWIKDIGTISVTSYTMNDYKDGYDYLTRKYPKYYNQKEIEAGNIRYVPMIIMHKDGTLEKYNEVADFNYGAKGKWIFMILHLKK